MSTGTSVAVIIIGLLIWAFLSGLIGAIVTIVGVIGLVVSALR